jgi:leucyl/phenylalanyl-tRNA--protein transferase
MSSNEFPDPRLHNFAEWALFGEYFYGARDIVSFGNELTLENLKEAYTKGIFPWHIEGMPLPWFCPAKRAIIEFSELKVPRSLEKERRKNLFTFTIDKDFDAVVRACAAAKRAEGNGTWITGEFMAVYGELHRSGMAHSVEAWDANGELAGGLYGVDAGGVFCGESMFHRESNASKLSLLFLIDHLKARGSTWLDAQVMTPHIKALGARDIRRMEFLEKLKATQEFGLKIFDQTGQNRER